MIQTRLGPLFLEAADSDSRAQLSLAARTGRPVAFTPVSLDSARRVLLVRSVRIM
jgi:hypothetical protein